MTMQTTEKADDNPQTEINKRVDAIVAQVLGVTPESLEDEIGYQSIPEWDSLRHVALMLSLEKAFGIRIDRDRTVELDSVRAIRAFVGLAIAPRNALAEHKPAEKNEKENAWQPQVHRGLVGIHVDRSTITNIDGEHGNLEYR